MKPYDYFLYALVVFGWSTSWLALKWQLGVVPPEISVFWRFILAAALMFGITALARQDLWIAWRHHWRLMGMGLCLFSGNFTLFYYGGLNSTSGLLAVIFSTASLINIFLLAVLFREPPKAMMIMAAILGFSGVGLIYAPELASGNTPISSLLICLVGTILFCCGNMLSGRAQSAGIPLMAANCWGMVYGVLILGGVSLLRGHEFTIEWTATYLGGMLWLSLISSVLAFTAYLALLGRIGSGKAGYATVLFPVGALLISTVAEDYQWTILAMGGLVLVMVGNIIMVKAR